MKFLPDARIQSKPASMLFTRFDVEGVGYVCEEFFVDGEALAFEHGAHDYDVKIAASAPYRTRLLVVRPINLEHYCGTVVVEWMNVSGGVDFPADWLRTHRYLIRNGVIWVGASVQRAGVEGEGEAGRARHLKAVDAVRYASLHHPGDAYAFDIFSQIGHLIKSGAFSFAAPSCLLACGFSRSARFLTTYVNLIDPHAGAYDGFMLSGRHKTAAGLDGASYGDAVSLVRGDTRAPVFVLQPEGDPFGLMNSWQVRQSDTAHFRLWEIAGAAHVDVYLMATGPVDDGVMGIAELADAYAPDRVAWAPLREPMNAAPLFHYVQHAALHHLEAWARTRTPPPSGVTLRGGPGIGVERDRLGVALGGVRTPWVDCPAQIYSGENDELGEREAFAGRTIPISQHVLSMLYPGGVDDYIEQFDVSLIRSIDAGYMLQSDARECLQLARALFVKCGQAAVLEHACA